MNMNSKFYVSMFFISLCAKHVRTTVTGDNICGNHNLRQKPNGQFHRVLELFCCWDFMEVDNRCLACPAGYFGLNCRVPCIRNTYGQQCKLNCRCTGYELCDPKAGCKCKAGYTGAHCDKECSAGFYGPSCIYDCECSKTSECNKKTGECTCDRGWIGKHCDNKCASGYYGIECAHRCSCSANHQCHHVTGYCHCEPGKQGSHCNETCDAGKYGMDCLQICSCQDCNPVDGVCQQIDNDATYLNVTCAPNCNCQDARCSNNGSHLGNLTTDSQLSSEADPSQQTKEEEVYNLILYLFIVLCLLISFISVVIFISTKCKQKYCTVEAKSRATTCHVYELSW